VRHEKKWIQHWRTQIKMIKQWFDGCKNTNPGKKNHQKFNLIVTKIYNMIATCVLFVLQHKKS